MLFKFLLFWWCVCVFAIMGVYILDNLMTRKFGSAKVNWSIDYTFKGGSTSRQQFWAQLVDPSAWSMKHPMLQTADIRMVDCNAKAVDPPASSSASADDDEDSLPESKLKPMDKFK